MRVLNQRQEQCHAVTLQEDTLAVPEVGSPGEQFPCPTALCTAKADVTATLDITQSSPTSYGQKQMQT